MSARENILARIRAGQGKLAAPSSEERDAVQSRVREALGERNFAAAWAAGRSAPLDLIVDQALDLVPTPA